MRSQVRRILLISIVMIVAGSGILGASFYFLYINGVKESEAKLAQVQIALKERQTKKAQIPGLEEQLKKIRIEAAKLKTRIPELTEDEFDNFIRHIYSVAEGTLVDIDPPRSVPQQRRPGTGGLPGGIEAASYELNVKGDYQRLWDFLSVLEKAPRFVTLENFGFVPYQESATKTKKKRLNTAKLTVRVTAYAAMTKAAPPPPQKAAAPKDRGPLTSPPPE